MATDAPALLRPTTTFGLTPEEISQSYVGMAGRSMQFLLHMKFNSQSAKMQEVLRASDSPKYTACAIASVAQADGEFSELEQSYFRESAAMAGAVGPRMAEIEEEAKSMSLEEILKAAKDSMPPEFFQKTPAARAVAQNFSKLILLRAMACSAQDGLTRTELDAAYRMSDMLGLDHDCARQVAEMMRLEQDMFVLLDKLMIGGGKDLGNLQGLPPASVDATSAPPLLAQSTTAGLTNDQMSSAYVGQAGFAVQAYGHKKMGIGNPEGPMSQIPGREEIYKTFCKLFTIVAKGDGVLGELEEAFLRRAAQQMGVTDAVDEIVAADESQMDELLASFSAKVTEVMGGANEVWDQMVANMAEIMPIHVLVLAITTAAQDGLERAELNVAYDLGEKLNVSRDITRAVVECLRIEQSIAQAMAAYFPVGPAQEE